MHMRGSKHKQKQRSTTVFPRFMHHIEYKKGGIQRRVSVSYLLGQSCNMKINKASSVIVLLYLLHHTVCVPIDQFLKLGTQTSTRLGDNVDSDCGNSIDGGFRVCGRLYAGLCVSQSQFAS